MCSHVTRLLLFVQKFLSGKEIIDEGFIEVSHPGSVLVFNLYLPDALGCSVLWTQPIHSFSVVKCLVTHTITHYLWTQSIAFVSS